MGYSSDPRPKVAGLGSVFGFFVAEIWIPYASVPTRGKPRGKSYPFHLYAWRKLCVYATTAANYQTSVIANRCSRIYAALAYAHYPLAGRDTSCFTCCCQRATKSLRSDLLLNLISNSLYPKRLRSSTRLRPGRCPNSDRDERFDVDDTIDV